MAIASHRAALLRRVVDEAGEMMRGRHTPLISGAKYKNGAHLHNTRAIKPISPEAAYYGEAI